MALSASKCRHKLDIRSPGIETPNRFGDLERTMGEWTETPVSSWYVSSSGEKAGEYIERVITQLTVHLPPESAPPPGGQIRLPGGSVWEVKGKPDDYNHGPWHKPGLVAVHAEEVTG